VEAEDYHRFMEMLIGRDPCRPLIPLLPRAEELQSLDEELAVSSHILKNSEGRDFHIIPR